MTVFNDRNYSTGAVDHGHLNKSSHTLQANSYAHEHMLLAKAHNTNPSDASGFAQRVSSHAMSLNDILAANNMNMSSSVLHTAESSSSIMDSGRILKPKRSLNFITKKHEAERIDIENEKIM